MWKGIHFSFKPVQAYRHHCGEKTFIGPNLYQLWLQFQLERHEMVHTGPIKENDSQGGLSCFQYKLSFLAHCSHGLFSCVELHFGLLSAVEKLMYLQDCGFGEMFVTISSMSALVRPFPSVSVHVHLQVVSTRKLLAHSSHAEGLS